MTDLRSLVLIQAAAACAAAETSDRTSIDKQIKRTYRIGLTQKICLQRFCGKRKCCGMIVAILRAKLPLNEANIDDGAGFAAEPLASPRYLPSCSICLLLYCFVNSLSVSSLLSEATPFLPCNPRPSK